MVRRGVNKLPYTTTLIYDGDGANNALSGAMSRIGIATMFGIPYRQSLNYAERIIGNMTHIAKRTVYRAKLTSKWFGWAMEHAAHHHNYMYSKTRGTSPNEMVYGKRFDVRHLVPFAQLGFAHKSDKKMKDSKRNDASPSEALAKAEAVVVTGYPTYLSKTYRVQTLRGAGATMNSRDVVMVCDTHTRDLRGINSKMFEDNLDKTKVWATDSSEEQSIPIRGIEQSKESSGVGWMSDDDLIDKLIKYVHIKGGDTISKSDTIWELCERFNRSRKYLVDLALEEEAKAINGQTFKSLNSSLQEDNGEPESTDTEPRFGRAGEDRPIEARMGTRSGKSRDQISLVESTPVTSAHVSSEQCPRLLHEHTRSKDKKRVHFATHDCLQLYEPNVEYENNIIHKVTSNDTNDQVVLNIRVPRMFTKETIEIPQHEAYVLGDIVHNQPVVDLHNWNPSITSKEGPLKGWSYSCLHLLAKSLADEIAGFSRKKDISWKEALDTTHFKPLAIAAFDKEVKSLTEDHGVLRRLDKDDPLYDRASKEAIRGRPILDKKRDGRVKMRLVKIGFLEIKSGNETFTGHVVSPMAVRIAIASHKPDRKVAIVDVTTAF